MIPLEICPVCGSRVFADERYECMVCVDRMADDEAANDEDDREYLA